MGFGNIEKQLGPEGNGVAVVSDFFHTHELEEVKREIFDPSKVTWRDKHDLYKNKRGLTIVENHEIFALKMSHGDSSYANKIPHAVELASKTRRFITSLSPIFPSLFGWNIDELSFHRYDKPDVGLSFHKDDTPFVGVIALIGIEGECEMQVREGDEITSYQALPGELTLVRAADLIPNAEGDLRPEHGVYNLTTPTRTSMILRDNKNPDKQIKGYDYENWP